jgi:hypothetical protein
MIVVMRKYWIIFIVFLIASFGGFGIIVYKCFIQKPDSEIRHPYLLNTYTMKEAGSQMLNIFDGPGIINIFPANNQNGKNDSIPWADVFICKIRSTKDSLAGDSNILVLDIKTDNSLKDIQEPNEFWTDIKPAKRFEKCEILISEDELDTLKKYKYKYKYGRVTLVTDDNNK